MSDIVILNLGCIRITLVLKSQVNQFKTPLKVDKAWAFGVYFLKSLRILGLVRCHSNHMFEIKSAREKQDREWRKSW